MSQHQFLYIIVLSQYLLKNHETANNLSETQQLKAQIKIFMLIIIIKGDKEKDRYLDSI